MHKLTSKLVVPLALVVLAVGFSGCDIELIFGNGSGAGSGIGIGDNAQSFVSLQNIDGPVVVAIHNDWTRIINVAVGACYNSSNNLGYYSMGNCISHFVDPHLKGPFLGIQQDAFYDANCLFGVTEFCDYGIDETNAFINFSSGAPGGTNSTGCVYFLVRIDTGNPQFQEGSWSYMSRFGGGAGNVNPNSPSSAWCNP